MKMKFRITDGAAAPLALLAITARVALGVTIDLPEMYCAGWLCALLGGLLAAPMAIAMAKLRAACDRSPAASLAEGGVPIPARLLTLTLAANASIDAAFIIKDISHTAGYLALGTTSQTLLLVPQLLLCLWGLTKNGDAIGSAARIWNRLLLCLLVIVFLLECKSYRPAWLTPILGDGVGGILDGAVRVAGWMSLTVGLFLFSEKEPEHPKRSLRPLRSLAATTLLSVLLIATRSMMTPPLVYGTVARDYLSFDTLLSNGRITLSLQFPILILWLVGLFMLLLFDVFICAAMLQTAFPALKGLLCALLAVGSSTALAMLKLNTHSNVLLVSRWLFCLQNGLLALLMLEYLRKCEVIRHA